MIGDRLNTVADEWGSAVWMIGDRLNAVGDRLNAVAGEWGSAVWSGARRE